MKKVFIVLMMALMSLGAQAQEPGYVGYVDEEDLIGRWKIFSADGDWESLKYPSYDFSQMNITFKEDGMADLGAIKFGPNYVFDWFISNSNKLHFIGINQSLRFVIWDYMKNNLLVLKAFNKDIYLHFKKENSSAVQTTRADVLNNNKYNLQGMKVEDPEGIYIQNGQKHIAK